MRPRSILPILAAIVVVAKVAPAADLKKETVDAFDHYVSDLESRLEHRWHGEGFLWSDTRPQKDQLQHGAILIEPSHGSGTIEIKSGLQPGDRIILSDMSAYARFDRIALR